MTIEEQTENVLEKLAASLFEQHQKIDREHVVRVIKRGPRRGQNVWDSEWNHGYRDALEDVRMAVGDALTELRAEVSS